MPIGAKIASFSGPSTPTIDPPEGGVILTEDWTSAIVLSSTTGVSSKFAFEAWFEYQSELTEDYPATRLTMEGIVVWNNAGDSVATFTVALPTGWEFDLSERLASGTGDGDDQLADIVGNCEWYDAGTGWKTGALEVESLTTFRFVTTEKLTGTSFANGDSLKFMLSAWVKESV